MLGGMAALQHLPDEMLYQLVRDAADPRDLGGQLFVTTSVGETFDGVERTAVGKVKAGLLIAALDYHFREGRIQAAWRGAVEPFLMSLA